MTADDFNTVDEFLTLCGRADKPKKGKKIVRCSFCEHWIREGHAYIMTPVGPFCIPCYEKSQEEDA